MGELVQHGRYLQALEQDPLLSLDADILGPLHESGQVTLRLDVVADTEVLRSPNEQWVLGLADFLSSRLSSGNYLLSLRQFLWLFLVRFENYLTISASLFYNAFSGYTIHK